MSLTIVRLTRLRPFFGRSALKTIEKFEIPCATVAHICATVAHLYYVLSYIVRHRGAHLHQYVELQTGAKVLQAGALFAQNGVAFLGYY